MNILQRSYSSHKNIPAMAVSTLPMFIILVLAASRVDGYRIATETAKYEQNCLEFDSCEYQKYMVTKLSPSNIQRNCACDVSCNAYVDCCIDAPKVNGTNSNTKCYDVKGFGGIYMIGECSATYDGDKRWKELCEKTEIADSSDPFGTIPVTDYDTDITYKNLYCSFCNGKLDLMRFWRAKLECPLLDLFNQSDSITDGYVLQNLVKEGDVWGLNLKQGDGMNFFLDCSIEPVMPLDLQHKARRCNPDLVSECPPTWTDEEIREKCMSYMAPRFTEDGEGYRNIHCAVCNNENVEDLTCQSPELDGFDIFRFTGTHSLALLLDISVKRGEKVGFIKLCETGEVFDPFFKKCRRLECLPGFIRRGRKCFPRKTIRRPSLLRRKSKSKATKVINKVVSSTTEFSPARVNIIDNIGQSVTSLMSQTASSINTSTKFFEMKTTNQYDQNPISSLASEFPVL